MLGKTHMAVGITAGLAIMHPENIQELIAGTGALTIGSVISDIDVGTSESHKDADRIIALSCLAFIAVAAAEAVFHLGIYQRLMRNSSLLRVVAGIVAFLLICAFGKEQPHRSFMHSVLALFLLTGCTQIFFPLVAPYFAIAFMSHLIIDLLNRKNERLLYPLKHGFSLGICSSKGIVNRILFTVGSVCGTALFFALLLRSIKSII